ncbi:MAG: D-2-hydroxyacid dehydrogenase, partial [Deltaproteobacteria bacterium]|nr:D-2-hydroxyacid dehydrogenase [Deltaproteobacteria bacterium]
SAYLINLVAGNAVEEEILGRAMREEWIAGAAINAAPEQPLSQASTLWDLPNVIVTPRLGSSGQKWDKVVPIFRDNLARFIAGQPLKNRIDKELGY